MSPAVTATLKQIIHSILPISENSFSEIVALAEERTFKKDEVFIVRDKKDNAEYFILKGVCKSYVMSPEGEEVTISFFQDKAVLSPHTTRIENGASILSFKALTELEAVRLNASAFEKLLRENTEIRNFGNTVLRNELAAKIEKEMGLASLTAKERLIRFREKFPLLENLIPHPDIASYLGITNISLSRLRRELLK